MAILVDSNVFIGLERRGLRIADLPRIGPDEPAALASITAAELLIGVRRSAPSPRTTTRSAFVQAICQTLPVLPFDLVAARVHAQLWSDLASAGTLIGPHDLLIAATAVSAGYAILTDNTREFGRIPDLVVIRPIWPN
jgi:predicted nucleic acid-binding protein